MESTDLETRARAAYERGRMFFALRGASWVLPIVLVTIFLGPRPWLSFVLGILLLATVSAFRFKGGLASRAVPSGVAAGVLAWVFPFLARGTSPLCPPGFSGALCLGGAVAGGLVGGLWLASKARAYSEGREVFLACAAWVGLLIGGSGCLVAGGVGALGMLGGFVLGSGPAFLPARSH